MDYPLQSEHLLRLRPFELSDIAAVYALCDGAELTYWIGRSYWGNGFATEAVQRVIQFGFEILKLQRIWATAMTKNHASIRVMTHANMQYEGTFRQHVLKWANYEDIALYGILKQEYESNPKESQK